MYYHRSRSPSRLPEGRSLSSYSRGLSSYNSFSADLALSSYTPRNRSIQRVLDSEYARPERSRSPMRDYTSSAALTSSFRPLPSTLSIDSSPVLKRRELGLTSTSINDSRSSPINWRGTDDYTLPSKPRSYYDFPSTSSSRYTSYSSTSLRRPQRIDYSDYFRPVLTTRPVLKSNYTPRPRAERESAAMPIVRERKLIKFRETANDILGNSRRKISWDLPEEIDSPLINEMRAADGSAKEISTIDSIRSRDSSLTRYESKEASPRDRSLTRYDSKDSHSRDDSLTHASNRRDSGSSTASASRRSSDHSIDRMSPRNLLLLKPPRKSSNLDSNDLGLSDDSKLSPVPRKKSIGSLPKSKKHRKSSIETSDEKCLKHSIIADKIRRGQDSPDSLLVDSLITQKSDASTNIASNIDKCESELSLQADVNFIPDVIPETQDDINLRRRRTNISETYSEQDKLEENARSRCRSRVRSTQELPSHSQSSFADSESEAVRPINRMHRKSVKYKMEQPSSNQFSKVSVDTQQSSVAFPAEYARDPIKEFRKENDGNSAAVDNSLDVKLKQNKTFVDSNVTVNNEVSQIHLKEQMTKGSKCTVASVDKIAKDEITVSKEQVCPDVDLTPSNLKQTKTKKIKKKDVLKGGSKTNKTNILDTISSNEKKIDIVQPLDTSIKPPVHNENAISASSEKSSISKQQSDSNSKFIGDNSKKVEITKLTKTIGANTKEETDFKNIPDFLKKSPCVKSEDLISKPDISNSKVKQLNSNSTLETESKLDKPRISDTKNVDAILQPSCKHTLINKSDKLGDSINTNLDLKTTAVINSKTSLGNKYVETDLKTNSKNFNKDSSGVEQKSSTLQQNYLDNVSNKLVSSNIEKDIVTSGINESKIKSKVSNKIIGSELKVDSKKGETKIYGTNGTDSKKQIDSFPSLTNQSQNELESKQVKTNTKANQWNKISLEEPSSEINENKLPSLDKARVQMKINSQLASGKTNQLSNTSDTGITANVSDNTKTNQLIKVSTSIELKNDSKIDKTEISQTNCPNIVIHTDSKTTSVIPNKQSNTNLKDKPINTDNKNINALTLKSNKTPASGSPDADKTSALPPSLKCPDVKSQLSSKFPNILKEKKCDNTTDNKTFGDSKTLVLEKDKAKRTSETNESNKLTQNVICTGFKQIDPKQTPTIVGKQLDKTNTTPDIVQLPIKNIKTKPTSEFLDTSKASVSQNSDKDQGEIVVVCKLPPPFKKESIKHDIPDNIPIDQSLVVSLRKSTKLHVLGKHFEPIGKNKSRVLPIIPNQHAFPVPKEVPKSKNRALTSVNEEPEINAPIFSKAVDQKLNAVDENTNSKMRLKSIPDVIQSSIKINSQTVTLENNSNISTINSKNSLKEQSLVLPNIKDGSLSEVKDETSSVNLRKPDILNVKRVAEEPLNKYHATNKGSLVSAKAAESQVKKNSEKDAILTENKKEPAFDKLPKLSNNKDNSTCVTKSDAASPKTDLPNIKQTNLKNIKIERKPEIEVLSHESDKISAINVSEVKSCHSEIGNKKLSSDLTKLNILSGKEVNKELENKDSLSTTKSSVNVKHSEQKSKLNLLNLDVKIPAQQPKSIATNSDVKILEQQSKSKVTNLDGRTLEKNKSEIVNSDVKISEQQTKSIANSDVKVLAQQNKSKIVDVKTSEQQIKSKIVNSDLKIQEQTKSKNADLDVKIAEQTKSKIVHSDVKIPEQTKSKINSDVKISEQTKSKINSDLKIPEQTQSKIADSDVKIPEQTKSKIVNSNIKIPEQTKSKIVNSEVKIPEQTKSKINSDLKIPEQTKSKIADSDVKITEQTKSKIVNSDVKIPEQTKSKINLDLKIPEQTKSKIADSDVKIPEQTKSKIVNSDIKIPEQTKSKIVNSDVKIPEQTKSKIVNPDVKIPEQQTKSIIIKTEVKLPEQSKVVNTDLKIPEYSKTKTENLNIKLIGQQIKTITTSSNVKLVEVQNKPKVVNTDLKFSEQQIKSTITNSEGQPPEHQTKSKSTNSDVNLPEQVTKSKYFISDKSSKKEDNVDKVVKVSKFKDTEKYIKKEDLSVKTSKPTNESSRPYKRSVTTPNVDTLLDSSTSLTNVDISRDETNKSLTSSNISTTLLKANKSLSNEPLKIADVETKSAYVKDLTNSYSKEKAMDKSDKIIPGQNSQQVVKDLNNQAKNIISSPVNVSSSSFIKDTITIKVKEDVKSNSENISMPKKGTSVAEIKKENVVECKNKKLECQKPQSSEVAKTSETEKTKIDSKIVTSKDNYSKVLNSDVKNTKQLTFKDQPLKDEKLSSMNITPQTVLCDKKDKSLKLNQGSKELIKDKNEIIPVEKVDSLKEKEKTEPLNSGNILTKTKNEACLKADKTPKDKKANCVENAMASPNSSDILNYKAQKGNDLPGVNTAKLNSATNVDRAKPVPSNSVETINSMSNKLKSEITKVNISPKDKTSEIKQTVDQDVNGNSPRTIQVLSAVDNSSVNENISICDTKTVDGHNKVRTRGKESSANSKVDTSQTKTLATNTSATIPVDPSAINENVKVSKPTIPPPEILKSEKASTTDVTKPKEPEKIPKVAKVKPPPAPRQWGLCFRYHETIRESSSSDDSDESESESSSESSYSSETETTRRNARYRQPVTRRNLLDNECNIACHQKCEKLMPNLCGVNQKLLSEVLETVKKGKTSPDRQEKIRTQISNASISTTVTNVSVSSNDDTPKKPPTVPQKLKFRQYSIDDFVFLKLLGKGSFGKVLLAELKDHGMHFAIKCLKKDVVLEDDDVESTMIERKILRLGTQHPYMCKLYCTFQTKSYLFFVMEYLNGGDLMFHIQQKSPFDVKRAMFYGAEIVSALKFLHKRGIIYRDIKLDNVMLDVDGHIRLVDFGMCHCRMYSEDCMPSNYCGTPTYIAPEIILGKRYNQSVDWWSFGILLFEMLAGRSPFVGTDEDELFWSICNEEPFYPRFLPKDAKHILENLLIKTPNDRLGMPTSLAGNVEDHPFFSTINWDKLEKKQIPPPFKPTVLSASDTGNFDRSFTMDSPTLSPVDSDILESMDQEQFQGFSYTNPHITG